jgi:iron complex transport system ATP-binding protein
MGLLKRLTRETDKAVLLSTHDLDLAIQIADVLWLISSGGTIDVGAPEDLILSDSVENNFTSEGVSFDKAHGAFILHQPVKAFVRVEGEGLIKHWTEKALHREGYQAREVDKEYEFTVECYCCPNTWILCDEQRRSTHSSIYELIKTLRYKHHHPETAVGEKERR